METLQISEEKIIQRGFLEIEVDPALDLAVEIARLKKEKNCLLLAHYYQEPEIQDIADFVGDSLGLAQAAAKTEADMILFAGVHFMAETAKILNPGKKVLLPDLKAGCSLSDSCPPPIFRKFREAHPDHLVISYINCSAGIKALSDIICTSSNAQLIVESLPADQKIIFAPDKNLGGYINKQTGRQMLLWNGACFVHEIFSRQRIVQLKLRNPDALIIAHPECEEAVLQEADFIGSTSQMIQFTQDSPANSFIVATEPGILHVMERESPHKTFIPAPPDNACACNNCPHMKLNTLEKVYVALKYELPEVTLPQDLLLAARKPIDRMLELSRKLGL